MMLGCAHNNFFNTPAIPIVTDADTCTGDGGGPLMCATEDSYTDYKGESIPIYELAGLA